MIYLNIESLFIDSKIKFSYNCQSFLSINLYYLVKMKKTSLKFNSYHKNLNIPLTLQLTLQESYGEIFIDLHQFHQKFY